MLSNISWPQLLILLVLVVLIFGTTKLKSLGKDVGGAVKGFKKAMNDEETAAADSKKSESSSIEQKDAEFAEQEPVKNTDKAES